MKKIICMLVVMVCLLLVPAFAQYLPGQSIDLRTSYTIDGIPSPADAYISITLPNSTIAVNNTLMTELETGRFQYIYTFPPYDPSAIGPYYFDVTYTEKGNSTIIGSASGTFTVGETSVSGGAFSWTSDDSTMVIGQCPASVQGIFMLWGVIALLVLLSIIGLSMKFAMLPIISGTLMVFLSTITWSCGFILGTATILFGLAFIIGALNIRT